MPPILFIGHLDVVEARREDWSMDPFQFIEQDGNFYGRGTRDMKSGDAILVMAFLRLKREDYQPDRDLILALTADEESGRFQRRRLAAKGTQGLDRRRILHQSGWRRIRKPQWGARPGWLAGQREGLRRFSVRNHQPRRPQLHSRPRKRDLRIGGGSGQTREIFFSRKNQ